MEDKQKAILAIFFASTIGGATVPLSKLGLEEFPPLSFAFIRFVIATFLITPFLFKTKGNFLKDLKALTPFSLLATANIIVFILGLKTTTATIGQLLYAGVPLLTGLIGYLFLRQKLPFPHLLGILIGFMGVTIIILLPILQQGNPFSGDLVGNVLIAGGVLSTAIYMVLSKDMLSKFSPFIISSSFIIITTMALLPLFLLENIGRSGWWQQISAAGIVSLIYVATVSTVGWYTLKQYAIKYENSVFASMAFYLTPVLTYIFAFFILGELLTPGLIFGGALALLGVFLVTKRV